jgi:hypothetical protein
MTKKISIITLAILIITNVFSFSALPVQASSGTDCITLPATLQSSVGDSVLSRLCNDSSTSTVYSSGTYGYSTPGCLLGYLYNTITGQLCSGSTTSYYNNQYPQAIPGCYSGYAFSTITGQSCTGNNNTYTYPYTNNALNTINITAPTRLSVGTPGAWIVTTNNLNSTYGNYNNYGSASVRWGDENNYNYYNSSSNNSTPTVSYLQSQQTSTFTHTYQTAGTYTVTFTTTDSSNKQNTATVTVVVSGNGYGYGQPTLSYLSPSSGRPGTQIILQGSGFATGYSNTLHFGIDAVSNIQSSNNGSTIYYTIPYAVYGTTYPIYVTTPSGTSNTLYFTVTQ